MGRKNRLHALLHRPDAPGDVLGWWTNSVLEAASSPSIGFSYVKLCKLCCERSHLRLFGSQVYLSALFLSFGSYSSTLLIQYSVPLPFLIQLLPHFSPFAHPFTHYNFFLRMPRYVDATDSYHNVDNKNRRAVCMDDTFCLLRRRMALNCS